MSPTGILLLALAPYRLDSTLLDTVSLPISEAARQDVKNIGFHFFPYAQTVWCPGKTQQVNQSSGKSFNRVREMLCE